MPTPTARTAWTGSFPQRAADDAGGTTSPEELVAAAKAGCPASRAITGVQITLDAALES